MSDNSRWEPFTKDKDAWNYLSLPTLPTVRGKGPEYRKPISIDEFLEGRDSTPKELIDLRTDFFNQKDKIRKSISVPFEGGRFVASPNTSIFRESDDPIIKYYFDNSEADAAAGKDLQDLESIQSIFTTVAGAGASIAGAKPKPQNIVLKRNDLKVQIPLTKKGRIDAKNLSRILDDIIVKRTDNNLQSKEAALQTRISQFQAGSSKSTRDLGLTTQSAKDSTGKFEFQGNFMFDRDGRIHWNKIDPSSKQAWNLWLDLTARKSGYESMKEMVRVMRDWPDEKFQEHMTELWLGSTEDGTPTNPFPYIGYSEHKKAKASKKGRLAKIQRKHPDWNQTQISEELVKKSSGTYDMDWLHDTEWIDHTGTLRTDGIGLGNRHAPENMLPLFNSRWKQLKDIAEGVGYGGELKPGPLFSFSDGTWRNPNQRFYIDVEDPGKGTKQYLRHNPGDLIIRRASNNKIIGNLGSYLDALYPKDESLQTRLQIGVSKTINPSTGKFFSSITEFRKHVILERINIILRDTHTLPSNATKRKRYIKKNIQEDMDRLFAQYPFLKPTKALSDEIAADPDLSEEGWKKRGQGKRKGIPELGSITKIKASGRVPTEDEYKDILERDYGPD